jgi:hypothetical protein
VQEFQFPTGLPQLIQRCWLEEPSYRPDMLEVVNALRDIKRSALGKPAARALVRKEPPKGFVQTQPTQRVMSPKPVIESNTQSSPPNPNRQRADALPTPPPAEKIPPALQAQFLAMQQQQQHQQEQQPHQTQP